MTHDLPVNDSTAPQGQRRFVLVTGPAGSGRSSALKVLEDAGFETIDNLPLRLLSALLNGSGQDRSVALGIDPRNRDFSTNGVLDLMGVLSARDDLVVELLFLDCATDTLLQRFSETRRRHPLAPDDRPADGIQRERDLLAPIKVRADVLIDTTHLNVHELRAEVEHWFAPKGQHRLTVSLESFSYKRGLPRSVDMVFDCRFLRNPYWDEALRPSNGTDPKVQAYVAQDERFDAFADQITQLSALVLPACREEGKSHFSIAFGCTGGQHRSVTMVELLALRLAQAGWQVSIRHRELDRKHLGAAQT